MERNEKEKGGGLGMKLYLSMKVVERMGNEIDYGEAESANEVEELMRIKDDILWANDHRDVNGDMDISPRSFAWLMARLDWIASRYYDMEGDGNGR